jgi:hypothetical protein
MKAALRKIKGFVDEASISGGFFESSLRYFFSSKPGNVKAECNDEIHFPQGMLANFKEGMQSVASRVGSCC